MYVHLQFCSFDYYYYFNINLPLVFNQLCHCLELDYSSYMVCETHGKYIYIYDNTTYVKTILYKIIHDLGFIDEKRIPYDIKCQSSCKSRGTVAKWLPNKPLPYKCENPTKSGKIHVKCFLNPTHWCFRMITEWLSNQIIAFFWQRLNGLRYTL